MTDANRRTLRTVFQTALALAAAAPVLVHADWPAAAVVLGVSAAVTKAMSLDTVERLLPGWLKR